ncbi:recombinase family protein [Lacrimispora brassicae]
MEDRTIQVRERSRRVAFYARVSTEHEAQISALQNQIEWYDDLLKYHNNWTLIDKYIDEGITGTQAKKRPAFLKMMEDAKYGKFDLIVTREVCRFARNTVDVLVCTRELSTNGVEVYFVQDNIWTMDSDGEMRLSFMATFAQDESRRISIRTRAGQYTSRQRGVIYGNGNILGYDRKDGTYIVNQEQAETVKIIYKLYLEGLGTKRIINQLLINKRKDTSGNVAWSASKINRILRNCTYTGIQGYKKSQVNDFLEQKRINNHDESTYEYKKSNYEPIISKEDYDKVQEIRLSRRIVLEDKGSFNKQKSLIIGKKESSDVWLKKLRCSCGSTFRKNKWRTNKNSGEQVFGYQCYNQVNNGSKGFREKNGLDVAGYCDIPMVADWKLDCMASYLIDKTWTNKKESVITAYNMIADCYEEERKDNTKTIEEINKEMTSLVNKKEVYIEMRADGELSKEEFIKTKEKIESKISELKEEIELLQNKEEVQINKDDMLAEIKVALEELSDFSDGKVQKEIIDKFVERVTPVNGNKQFDWTLNFENVYNQRTSCMVEGRKNNPSMYIMENGEKTPIKVPCSAGSS